jgi:hypothetical protein
MHVSTSFDQFANHGAVMQLQLQRERQRSHAVVVGCIDVASGTNQSPHNTSGQVVVDL